MSWSLLGAFCPQYMDILIKSEFSPYRCTSGFGDKGSFVVTDGGLGKDCPDRDLDILQEGLKV